MKVRDLKRYIANLPDDAIVVMHSMDHQYRIADVYMTTAIVEQETPLIISEDFGDDDYGYRIQVLLVQ